MSYCCLGGGRQGRAGLGFIPLLIGAAASAAPMVMGSGAAKDAARAADQALEVEKALEKQQRRSEEASYRLEEAQATRGQVLRYSLYGAAGLLLVGALGVYLLTRKKG